MALPLVPIIVGGGRIAWGIGSRWLARRAAQKAAQAAAKKAAQVAAQKAIENAPAIAGAAAGAGIGATINAANKADDTVNEVDKTAAPPIADTCSTCPPPLPPEDEDDDEDKPANYDKMSKEDQRSVRSLQKRIKEHIKKLNDFKDNPTVRPGMENQPEEIILKQHQSRINHLQKEIDTFRNNIQKLNDKY